MKVRFMRKIIGLVCFLFIPAIFYPLEAAPVQLSPQAEVSVITAAAGSELYTIFGHTTIRVHDPANQLDKVYNYGTFNFDEPGYYWHFARGYLHYYLETSQFDSFSRFYLMVHRSLYEQVLRLTQEEKQALYEFLEHNALPENRYYRYDSFLNNCSTKVRDALQQILAGSVTFDDSAFTAPRSFREYIAPYLHQRPWGGLGINLLLGAPIDQPASAFQSMFLPNQLKNILAAAIVTTDSTALPIVENIRVYPAMPASFEKSGMDWTPGLIFWLIGLFLAGVTYLEWRARTVLFPLDGIILGVVGILGILFLFLWFGSARTWTNANYNLVWALPTHLIAAILLFKKRKPRILGKYFTYTTGLTLLLLISWKFVPQTLPVTLLPLVVILTIRTARLAASLGKSPFKV